MFICSGPGTSVPSRRSLGPGATAAGGVENRSSRSRVSCIPLGSWEPHTDFLKWCHRYAHRGMPVPASTRCSLPSPPGRHLPGFCSQQHALRSDGSPPIRIVGVQVYPGQARRLVDAGAVSSVGRSDSLACKWTGPWAASNCGIERPLRGIRQIPGPFLLRLCLALQQESGIDIDPIFGGKTWSVMEQRLAGSSARDDRPMLYWHSWLYPDWQAFTTSAS